jgi:hypothetical protein
MMTKQAQDLKDIMARLEKYDRLTYRLKLLGVAGLLIVSASCFLLLNGSFFQKAVKPSKVITAERVEIVDKDGNRRAVLGVGPYEEVRLALLDKNENECLALNAVDRRCSGLNIYDENGKSRIGLFILTVLPFFYMRDQDENARISMSLAKEGYPEIALYGDKERHIWKTPPPSK